MLLRLLFPAAVTAAALSLAATASAAADDLVPAGSINGVFSHRPMTVVAQDDRPIVAHAEAIRKRFMADAGLMRDDDAARADLAGHNLLVYGTLAGNAWLKKYADQLPFTMEPGVVRLEGREFEGDRLRVICAVRNPQDFERRAVLYVSEHARDIRNINNVFHGPTGWVVANGDTVLGSGDFSGPAMTKAAMTADLDFLAKMVSEIHPATVDGLTPALGTAIAEARKRIDGGIDEEAFWKAINGVVLALGDSHSQLRGIGTAERIDLPIAWLNEGPVVTVDTDQLRRGDLILAIGAATPAELLEGIDGLMASENAWHSRNTAERALVSTLVLRHLGAAEDAPVAVRVERAGAIVDLELPAVHGRPRPRPNEAWVRYTIEPEHDLGIFTLDRCVNDGTYRETLDRFFQDIAGQGIGRIVVDLRENGGGNSSVTGAFLRYVDVPGYADFSAEVRVSPLLLQQGRYPGKPRFDRYGPQRKTNTRVSDPKPFDGSIYVLTSRHTFSSGTWFATVLQDNGIARIVGEPSGGKPSHYGDIVELALPASGIGFTLSHKNFRRPGRDRDPADALTPDITVPMTRAALIAGTDPALDHVRKLEQAKGE